jgi:hypothetical protein
VVSQGEKSKELVWGVEKEQNREAYFVYLMKKHFLLSLPAFLLGKIFRNLSL